MTWRFWPWKPLEGYELPPSEMGGTWRGTGWAGEGL